METDCNWLLVAITIRDDVESQDLDTFELDTFKLAMKAASSKSSDAKRGSGQLVGH